MIPWAARPSFAFEATPVRLPGSLSMSGGGGIRTREGFTPTRFPGVRHKPLGDPSRVDRTGIEPALAR
jgi:hypothetical protein